MSGSQVPQSLTGMVFCTVFLSSLREEKNKTENKQQNKAKLTFHYTKADSLQGKVEGEKKKKLKITLLELFYIVINIIRFDIQTLWFTSTSSQCNVYRLPP